MMNLEAQYLVYQLEPMCNSTNSGGDSFGGLNKDVVGDILVIVAQVILSMQLVYEEKVVSQYAIAPLQAVGWEGV